ncbi:hypothetical protein OIO90_002558 [Microbotryomycetes sp. JL221]|nr:hypothetical protein OIO90_002558 [Microbotryomycetes sp. JL221]
MKTTLKRLSWNSSNDTLQAPLSSTSWSATSQPSRGLSTPTSLFNDVHHTSALSTSSSLSQYPFPHVTSHDLVAQHRSAPASPLQSPGAGSTTPRTHSNVTFTPQVGRVTLQKTLTTLTELLSSMEAYKQSIATQYQSQTRLTQAINEFAKCFGSKVMTEARNDVVAGALQATMALFQQQAQLDETHHKLVKTTLGPLNEQATKFLRKVAKEERAFDEELAALDTKMNKATSQYERNKPPTTPRTSNELRKGVEQHDKYISTMTELSQRISTLKQSHALSMGTRRRDIAMQVATTVCQLAETNWKNKCDSTRTSGLKIGSVVERGIWCTIGLPCRPDTPDIAPSRAIDRHSTLQEAAMATLSSPPRQTTSFLRGPRPPLEHQRNSTKSTGYTSDSAEPTRPVMYESSLNSMSSSCSAPSTAESGENEPSTTTNATTTLRQPPTGLQSSLTFDNSPPTASGDHVAAVNEFRDITKPLEQVTMSRPSPRYALSKLPLSVPVNQNTGQTESKSSAREDGLNRSDTTASEQSFVAKMRQVYVEQKYKQMTAMKSQQQQQQQEQQRSQAKTATSAVPTRSPSRVSQLAKRYSLPVTPTSSSLQLQHQPHQARHYDQFGLKQQIQQQQASEGPGKSDSNDEVFEMYARDEVQSELGTNHEDDQLKDKDPNEVWSRG